MILFINKLNNKIIIYLADRFSSHLFSAIFCFFLQQNLVLFIPHSLFFVSLSLTVAKQRMDNSKLYCSLFHLHLHFSNSSNLQHYLRQ
ncbi:hypothetical protein RchiOBHm_Chr1g0326761 [Rosa chinensis]|uniref:Uncharacterized protein n=1 Tax=Rosa chinensis TaxID=74649 RepID=A0A2P6SAC1_ROSCH|nr:hypothetical protein RchiOBHm_Chr1g0326761 [Rosa chinensis]